MLSAPAASGLALVAILGLFGLTGCEDEEANQLAQAQACLNKVDDAHYADAENCRKHLKGVNSQQSWIIQCSIDFLVGGLTTTKIVNAFKELEDDANGTNKEAYFIGTMALNDTAVADNAFTSCQKSKVDSMIYIAAMARTGTYLSAAVSGILDGSGNVDPAKVDQALQDCASATPTSCNPTKIGESVIALQAVYCGTDQADADVCDEINKAIDNSGGNPATVGQLLTCLLQEPADRGPECASL